ncbi:efflux RND transporter permease subunit [Flavobacterium sp. Fl-318]|uniref:Efflux RND transporter permease subunit n=1 Tax=Flavobacterium cupriresistens TaxID=2893885 RepID=A0ABU4RGT7_9FLAO|nr:MULTISPECIES: efflux RND transporter permease subunit [unclassified Flavobacterium]MDX6191804.1 efflux RND transporter permease subunit [Flavobacterium sp. Fl-318]UFH41747.1 efflux RND transporter permease subunit [Flavobacterium sp. F-323]
MNLIRFALRKPISILVMVAGLFFFGIGAIKDIKVDILPKMNLPVIYIAHPFGGYTPDQMEAYFAKNYVNILPFANGVKSVETKNVQGLMIMKLTYYENTNMAQAAAELSALSNRIQAAFPPGTQPPFIIRFDASSLPIGQLVLSSKIRSNNELQDLANVYVRASFTSIPGLLSPAPFGGSPRTVEVNVDPDLLRSHNMTPDQIVEAIRLNNQTAPSGNVRIGDKNYITPTNNTIRDIKDFEQIPLFKGGVQNLKLGDVATVKDGADITNGYALVNGKRSVYISIAKAGDASTWDVVQKLKAELPKIQSTLPEDVKLSYEFDQSVYVINSVKSLITEGIIGAVLTGLMVLLFLGDKRAALIVILTIPISIISGVLFLKLFGQTINLMSLSGLALAIGILVDESTVTIENIHQHLDMGKPKALAIWDACQEIALPKLLILLCILAVFAPAFTMVGIPGALFLPLALAIGFSMVFSFLLSQTFVPVMANWLMKGHPVHEHDPSITDDEAEFNECGLTPESERDLISQKKVMVERDDTNRDGKISTFERFRIRFMRTLDRLLPHKKATSLIYLIGITVLALVFLNFIGKDVFPKVNSSQFQLRMRAADGTRIERTEEKAILILKEINKMVGKEHVGISSVYVGQHPSLFSINPIYLFTAGPHEAVFQVSLKEYHVDMDEFKDDLRARIKKILPDVKLTFEPIELTDKVLSQGSPTPIEIRIAGKDKKRNELYASQIVEKLQKIAYFRDVQIGQPIHYPALNIDIDRTRAAELGVDMNDISRSLIASTSSSRYTEKNTWIDEKTGLSVAVQVQVPLSQMKSKTDIGEIPVLKNSLRPVLSDVAKITPGFVNGENDNLGAMPYITVTANIHQTDLGTATKDVAATINSLGELPRGLFISPIGLSTVLSETLSSLQVGLLVAIMVIFLMLAANFQSFKVSLVILTTVPAVVLGALLMLTLTGSTLNLQSYMGIIMSVGVSIANAVLLVTNAEQLRKRNGNALESAREAAALRLRPIIMTSVAMIAGMLPMAIGHGEGGDQVSPLGRAVIGGLLFSTFAVLLILPLIFAWAQEHTTTQSVSLDPEDEESIHYISTLKPKNEK